MACASTALIRAISAADSPSPGAAAVAVLPVLHLTAHFREALKFHAPELRPGVFEGVGLDCYRREGMGARGAHDGAPAAMLKTAPAQTWAACWLGMSGICVSFCK